MTGAALITPAGAGRVRLQPVRACSATPPTRVGKGEAFLEPGLRYGTEARPGLSGKIDLISLGLALVLGTAGLPHILIRFYTVPTARAARKSVMWGIGIIGIFYLFTLVLGFGAAALVGSEAITGRTRRATRRRRSSPRRSAGASATGGTVLLAVIAAVAFATILAVVAGLTLASSSSFAHDLYAHVFRKGKATERDEVRVARIAALVIGAVVDRPRHLRPAAERGVPGRAGVRGRGVGQPARDPLLPVLEAVQHRRRGLGDLRRPRLGAVPGRSSPRSVSGTDRPCSPTARLPLVPAGQPGHRLDPARVPVRLVGTVLSKESTRRSTPRSRSAPSPGRAPRTPSRTEKAETRR